MINSKSLYNGNHSMLILLCAGFFRNQNEAKYQRLYEANKIYVNNLQVNRKIVIGDIEEENREEFNQKKFYANY